MCCSADWKREDVPDHKFDFVNTREFHQTDWFTRVRYIWVYLLLLKSVAVYAVDIFTAVTMLTTNHWTSTIYDKCGNNCAIKIPFEIAKWIFVGCIIFSFVLLAYETWKAKKVIDSRDISYAFTNIMANDYYSLRSYDHFCFFCQINNSTKKKDDFAFFIFFTFKGWKRLLLADGPRQSINALTLYSFAYANNFQTHDIPAYWDNSPIIAMLLFAMIFTVVIFIGSLILLIAAAVCYVPLLCYIQGNLKEYVCHKVDKRISELIKRKQRQRVARNVALEKKLAKGEAVVNRRGEVIGNVPQPTLPDVGFAEGAEDMQMRTKRKGERQRAAAGELGERWGPQTAVTDYVVYDRPPLPNYDSYDTYGARDGYGGYPPTPGAYNVPYGGNGGMYDPEAYSSSTHLTAAAAPLGTSGGYSNGYPPVSYAPQTHASQGHLQHRPTIERDRSSYGSGGGLAYDYDEDDRSSRNAPSRRPSAGR